MRALIFGVSGQDGHYLRRLLLAEGVSVFGVSRSGGDARLDVQDRRRVLEIVRQVRPDFVFNFAATSSTGHEHLWENHAAISTGTLAVLDAVETSAPRAKVVMVGSGLQFVNHGLPLDERAPLDHSSPYVVARNQSLFASRYFRTRGLRVDFAFLFNHDSPLRSARHINMRIAQTAVRIASGSDESLVLGDPAAEKEFSSAEDIVSALWTLARQDAVSECVVGSGVAYPVRAWIEACFNNVGLDWRDHVKIESGYKSPYGRLVSDPSLLRGMGWRPKVQLPDLANAMMDAARQQIS